MEWMVPESLPQPAQLMREAAESLRRVIVDLERELRIVCPGSRLDAVEAWRVVHLQAIIAAALFLEQHGDDPSLPHDRSRPGGSSYSRRRGRRTGS